jgi:hypothetical protein
MPDRRLSDVLTSLYLDYKINEYATSNLLDRVASDMYGDLWEQMDQFLDRSLPLLQILSINIWKCVDTRKVDPVQLENSITFEAEKYFPIMSAKLREGSDGGTGGQGRVFEGKFTARDLFSDL